MSNEKDSTMDNGSSGCLLALDTSTANLSLAWFEDGEWKAEMELEGERNHSVMVVPALQQLAEQVGRRLEQVKAVAVGHGPGSYTGVRIGVTVAKTLAWTLQVPLIGVSSLEALACAAMEAEMPSLESAETPDKPHGQQHMSRQPRRRLYVPLMDARRGQAYTAIYEGFDEVGGSRRRSASQRLSAVQGDGIMLLDDLLAKLKELGGGQVPKDVAIVFTGDTAPFAPQLESFAEAVSRDDIGMRVRILPMPMKASCIGKLALAGAGAEWLEGEAIHPFAPNYTQLAEAEAKLLARKAAEAKAEADRG